ncbi:hypothetical protein [Clostridium botulinum]|uniref:hypothetical protein n=1 Tax=Clostridium botulinum TaxID=1491 RepID=UPI0014018B22|nr:hypothetical protein [Clostridium botulinum]MBY6918150.1 hypothetical protein [Clostridium botulinum]NFQ39410.1 hypothetical protein [Clostridium botulinum]
MNKIVSLPIPVSFYKSSSGKTFYARLDLMNECFTGESRNSYDEAIEDLKKELEKENKCYKHFNPKE